MRSNVIKWLALFGLAFFIAGCSEEPKLNLVHIQGQTMGTYYQIRVVGETIKDPQAFQQEVDKRLELVNDQMSTYRPNSELSRFNKANSELEVSADTATVVKEGIRLARLTDGALDITVGPLVNLWGFGPDAKPEQVPSEDLITQTRSRVGISRLFVDGVSLKKDIPELYVDLSTLAKGFAVDKIAEYIEGLGGQDYLVDIGGELRLKGHNDKGVAWRIAIEKPVTSERAIQEVIAVGDNAIATSGDYRNYFEENGRRYSHIIEPASGKPINHKLVSVTVVAPSSMTADGLSTAIMVMGSERGMTFAQENQLAIFMVTKTETGFEEKYTEQFKSYLLKEAE